MSVGNKILVWSDGYDDDGRYSKNINRSVKAIGYETR